MRTAPFGVPIAAFEMTADEVLTAATMFHVGGPNILTTPALRAGATVTVYRQFDPALALEEIRRVRATLFVAVPARARLPYGAGLNRWATALNRPVARVDCRATVAR